MMLCLTVLVKMGEKANYSLIFAICCLHLFCAVNCAKLADLITHLPGYGVNLPSKQYSGYIPVGKLSGTMGYLHYWFIESEVSSRTCNIIPVFF